MICQYVITLLLAQLFKEGSRAKLFSIVKMVSIKSLKLSKNPNKKRKKVDVNMKIKINQKKIPIKIQDMMKPSI